MPLPRRPSGFQRLRSSTMTHGAMAFSFPVTSVLYGPGACLGWVSVNPPHPRVLPSSRGLLGARSVPVSILGIHLCSKPRRKALYPSRPFIRAPVFSDHALGAGAVLGTGESEVKKTNRRPRAVRRPQVGPRPRGSKVPGLRAADCSMGCSGRSPRAGEGAWGGGGGSSTGETVSVFRGGPALGRLPMPNRKKTPRGADDASETPPPRAEALT